MPRGIYERKKKTFQEVKVSDLDTTVPVNSSVRVSLRVNDQTFNGSGKTLLEAIQAIQPVQWKTTGTLTIQQNDKTIERLLPINQMRRLFNPLTGFGAKIARESFIKFLNLMLK